MRPENVDYAYKPATSTTVDAEPEVDAGLWAILAPEKDPIDWSFLVVFEDLPNGETLNHGRVTRADDTSEEHIRARLPRDGQIHHLRIEFRGGVGSYRRGMASTSLIAPAAPLGPTALEMVETTPTFQFGQAFTAQSEMVMKLCENIMSMASDAQKEANELRKAEIEANRKSFEQMAQTVARIEGMKADPVAAAFKAIKPFALKAGLYTAGAASEFIEEAGGVKAALIKAVSALGGGGKSEVFDKILQTIGAVAPALGGGGEEE